MEKNCSCEFKTKAQDTGTLTVMQRRQQRSGWEDTVLKVPDMKYISKQTAKRPNNEFEAINAGQLLRAPVLKKP